jgi:DNA-binding MarR family transcriptional regulator
MRKDHSRGSGSASFLLAQLGSHAASKFAERLGSLKFAPYHAGILRILSQQPGISQQDLAKTLNMHASRLVSVLDELQQRGLIERRPSERDRRIHELHLNSEGEAALRHIGEVAQEHHRALMNGLSADQQQQLTSLLEIILKNQGLARGVHPGYRRLGANENKTEAAQD